MIIFIYFIFLNNLANIIKSSLCAKVIVFKKYLCVLILGILKTLKNFKQE